MTQLNDTPTVPEIASIADLQALVVTGVTDWKQYGDVNAVVSGDLILFNYTQSAQFAGRWNWFERHSRGLILNRMTGEVVARPFPKFFNYGERMPHEDAEIVSITEKMDGSLGILYRADGEYRIATRGSFISDQAIWATEWLKQHPLLEGTPDTWTFLFEIIYPNNRIVVDYGERAELVLLALVDRFTGDELSLTQVFRVAELHHYAHAEAFAFHSLEDMLTAAKALTANQEGWVVHYSDGSRFKVKGDAYKIAHKIMTGATFKRVLEAVEQGKFDAMIEGVPDEFLAQVKTWKAEIDTTVGQVKELSQYLFDQAPKNTQKDFALWVQANLPKDSHAYLFALKSGRPLEPLIYRHAFEDRANADTPIKTDEA